MQGQLFDFGFVLWPHPDLYTLQAQGTATVFEGSPACCDGFSRLPLAGALSGG
jgi:hypothetical protein